MMCDNLNQELGQRIAQAMLTAAEEYYRNENYAPFELSTAIMILYRRVLLGDPQLIQFTRDVQDRHPCSVKERIRSALQT